MAALALAAGVLLGARQLFQGIADGLPRLAHERALRDADANARRLLSDLFGSVDVTSRGAQPFDGASGRVRFSTWTTRDNGWPEISTADLRLDDGELILRTDRRRVVLYQAVDHAAFDYLLAPGAGEAWVERWISPSRPPVAVRVRLHRGDRTDTMLVLVGRRG